MKEKIIIVSIISVCILVGVSFTSVVGNNNIEFNKKVSPLFNIRTIRAIEEVSEELSCEYIGKGENITISIPKRNHYRILLNQVLENIDKINKRTLNKIVYEYINNHRIWSDVLNDINKSNHNVDDPPTWLPTWECDPCDMPTIFIVLEDMCLSEVIIALLALPFFIVGDILMIVLLPFFVLFAIGVAVYAIYMSVSNPSCPTLAPFCEP